MNPLPAHTLFQDGRRWGHKPGRERGRKNGLDDDPARADRRQGSMSFGCRDAAEAALEWRAESGLVGSAKKPTNIRSAMASRRWMDMSLKPANTSKSQSDDRTGRYIQRESRGVRGSRRHEEEHGTQCGRCVGERLPAAGAPVAALASGLTRRSRWQHDRVFRSSIKTAAEVVSSPFSLRKRKRVGRSRSHVRQRLDGRTLVGHGAIDVTPRPQLRHGLLDGLRPNRRPRRHAFVYQRDPLDAKPSRLGRAFMAIRPIKRLF